MLAPVKAISERGQAIRAPLEEIQRKQDKLLDALTHPYRLGASEFDDGLVRVLAVYAHGAEAARVVMRNCPPSANGISEPSRPYAAQVWSTEQENWQTVTTGANPIHQDEMALHFAGREAFSSAEKRAKWHGLDAEVGPGGVKLESLFDSRAKLAEFWYDFDAFHMERCVDDYTKWTTPKLFAMDVADALFIHGDDNLPDPQNEYQERINIEIASLLSNWALENDCTLARRVPDATVAEQEDFQP